ncbi:MAG: tetratricopeptide repeat protein [Anaerolineales bacterium]|nr:tetratricopeptide repeat protein [Anaerolineales bacterium]
MPQEMAWVLRFVGQVLQTPWQAKAIYQKALTIFEEDGDERGMAETLYRLGVITAQIGDYREAQQFYQKSLVRSQKLGRQEIIMFCLAELSYTEWAFGNYQAAAEWCRESLNLAREIGYPNFEATTLRYLARIMAGQGDIQTAKKHLKQCIAIHEEFGLQGMKAEGLAEMATVAAMEQQFAKAKQLAQDSLALCQELEHRTGEITPYTVLGEAALGLADFKTAERHFHQALRIACEVWQPALALHALVGLARLFASVDEKAQAYETATFILHHPVSWQWSKDSIAPLAAELEVELPPDVRNLAQTQAKAKNLEQVVDELITREGYHA